MLSLRRIGGGEVECEHGEGKVRLCETGGARWGKNEAYRQRKGKGSKRSGACSFLAKTPALEEGGRGKKGRKLLGCSTLYSAATERRKRGQPKVSYLPCMKTKTREERGIMLYAEDPSTASETFQWSGCKSAPHTQRTGKET